MQIRTAILVAGTAVAILAPSASAGIPWEPAHTTAHTVDYSKAYRWDSATYSWTAVAKQAAPAATYNGVARHGFWQGTAVAPTTEHSFGQSKPSPKHVLIDGAGLFRHAALPSAGAIAAPDPNLCIDYAANCTDEQLCDTYRMNCDAWYAQRAADARAANEQPAGDSSSR